MTFAVIQPLEPGLLPRMVSIHRCLPLFKPKICYFIANTFLLDPESVSISNLTQTSFQLTVNGPEGNPDIDHFEVEAVGGGESFSCKILHKDESWECTIEGLSPATSYTTTTKSCMPWQGGCSAGLQKVVETPAA